MFGPAVDLVRHAFDAANEIGDFMYAAFASYAITTNLLVAGYLLVESQREAEHGLAFARNMRFGFAIDSIAGQLGLIRTLRGAVFAERAGGADLVEAHEPRIARYVSSDYGR